MKNKGGDIFLLEDWLKEGVERKVNKVISGVFKRLPDYVSWDVIDRVYNGVRQRVGRRMEDAKLAISGRCKDE